EPIDSLAGDGGGQEVDLSLFVLAERQDGQAARQDGAVLDDAAQCLIITQGPEASSHVIGVEIGSIQLRQARAAIDVAPDDRLARVVMVVFPDRVDQLGPGADALDSEGMQRLTEVPAVVASLGDDVDFLQRFWPTSPAQSQPVFRSKAMRQTLRMP